MTASELQQIACARDRHRLTWSEPTLIHFVAIATSLRGSGEFWTTDSFIAAVDGRGTAQLRNCVRRGGTGAGSAIEFWGNGNGNCIFIAEQKGHGTA